MLPAVFREELQGALFFALGDNNEVAIWPKAGFDEKMAQKKAKEDLSPEGSKALRRFTSHAAPVKMDGQFRIQIPETLREKARLDRERPLAIVGAYDRLEIWDAAAFDKFIEDEDSQ